jgi:diguanylate cyclase (GGDEF)-like protein
MSNELHTLEELRKRSDRLPTLPAVALKILEVARKDDVTVKEMEQIISADPPLAAKVLRIINSPFYSLPRKVTSVRQAISLLGINSLKNLALGFSLVRNNSRGKHAEFDYPSFWKKSIIGAVSGKVLSKWVSGTAGEDCFFLGLLEDIGILAINQVMPKSYSEVLKVKREKQIPLVEAEREVLGFDHAEAGATLVEKWGLPPAFHQPIRYHHEPDCMDNPALQPLARMLSASAAIGDFFYHERPLEALRVIRDAAGRQGVEDEVEELMIKVFSEAVSIGTIFELDMSRQKTYVEILEEANVELGKNSMNLQRVIRDQAVQNEQLQEQISRDGLTGLHNYRCFQELLDRELDRASRYRRPLALIMADIDHFKEVNDTYGHQMGDCVLVEIAKVFQQVLRKSDFVARYGGEEFGILLVETQLESALAMAERLREMVAAMSVSEDGRTAKVTVSFGVTAIDQQTPVSKDEVVRLADEALYEAKRTGRNRCCVRLLNPQRVAGGGGAPRPCAEGTCRI